MNANLKTLLIQPPAALPTDSAYLTQFIAFKWMLQIVPVDSESDVTLSAYTRRCLVGFPLVFVLALASYMIFEAPLMRIRGLFFQ